MISAAGELLIPPNTIAPDELQNLEEAIGLFQQVVEAIVNEESTPLEAMSWAEYEMSQ